MGRGTRPTIGDALSSRVKAQMERLRENLERRTHAAIQAQLQQAKAPWQRIAPLSKSDLATERSQKSFNPATQVAPQARRAAKPVTPTPTGPAKLRSGQVLRRERREFRYWTLPAEAAVREPASTSISKEERAEFKSIVETGLVPNGGEAGEELFAIIGIDLGTSTTKIIVRFPYEAGVPTIAIPAPVHCRSAGQPYLWKTALWVRSNGVFVAWPEPGAHLLYSLKQGIVLGEATPLVIPGLERAETVTRADAAAAFVAFVLRYVRGWLFINRRELFRRRRAVWFMNVGLPAASYDDPSLVSVYRRMAATGYLLSDFDVEISARAAQAFLRDGRVVAAGFSADGAENLGVAILPETTAEVAGFAKSTSRAAGVYLMVDVGAMTLDVCAFRLGRWKGSTDIYALLTAQVRPLGVESYYWFLRQGMTDTGFEEQCNYCVREVVWGTKRDRDPRAECWKEGNALPVFLVGGGAHNGLHRDVVRKLDPWLRHHAHNGGIRLLTLPTPTNIDLPEPVSDFGRLAVAWGLSYPYRDIGEILSQSRIADMPRSSTVDFGSRYVSKDQV